MIPGIIIITLLVLLATKELVSIIDSEPAQRTNRFLIIPIIPLLIVFALLIALRVNELIFG